MSLSLLAALAFSCGGETQQQSAEAVNTAEEAVVQPFSLTLTLPGGTKVQNFTI